MAFIGQAGGKVMRFLRMPVWRGLDVEDLVIAFACVVVVVLDRLF